MLKSYLCNFKFGLLHVALIGLHYCMQPGYIIVH